MNTTNKFASAALLGLMTAGLFAAQPAFAGEHDKGACGSANGCKGKAGVEKSECKAHDEKAGCQGKESEDASCAGKSGCAGKEEK